jgi:hypothetical protein
MAGKKGRSGRPPGSHDISPLVRAQFLRAIEIHKKRTGKSFAEVLANKLERDLLGTLNTVAKFNVKESKVDACGSVPLEVRGLPATDPLFAEYLAQRKSERLSESSEDRPILLAPARPE